MTGEEKPPTLQFVPSQSSPNPALKRAPGGPTYFDLLLIPSSHGFKRRETSH